MAKVAPYGSWESPVSARDVASGGVGLGAISVDGRDVYWLERRPDEGGRSVIVRRSPDGETKDVNPAPFNARTRVHEYGGGDFVVRNGVVYFSNFADQALYRARVGQEPERLTNSPQSRYADMILDEKRDRIICVREDHSENGESENGEPRNELIEVALSGGSETVLASGSDFYSSPRLSSDGKRLAWLAWDHPNMPWDGTELWTRDVDENGNMDDPRKVAGGENESIFQPEFSPDGTLHFVSDRTGWWNLYREGESLQPMEAEFGLPQWGFGMTTYAFLPDARIACTYIRDGESRLALLGAEGLRDLKTPYSVISGVKSGGERLFFRGGSPTEPTAVVAFDPETGEAETLKKSRERSPESGYLSEPDAVEFPTEGGLTAHAFFYPPKNRDFEAPEGEKPPLIVKSHGGPTAMATASFDLALQYWTSRGFAVLDVNYGGSSGYGREYRKRLRGSWGVVDVDDCVNGAKYLVERGLADAERLAITGGSAGGYTTLCALAFRDVFAAGASHFGVSDAEALAKETHKFESRYLDSLIGEYPNEAELYRERSPIHFAERLSCPVIFFQGLEDEVVPPNQAEAMVESLRKKGIPVAYVPFEGEQHGFRKSGNIERAITGEFYFYSRVFGFELSEEIEPVEIENLR